jgi:2-oxo-4-hydroxy-4-carboxy--5-ureidoimidazoline (OHCU) decarboxylase
MGKTNSRDRIKNEINLEFNEAKLQVKKIANFRLNEIIN